MCCCVSGTFKEMILSFSCYSLTVSRCCSFVVIVLYAYQVTIRLLLNNEVDDV